MERLTFIKGQHRWHQGRNPTPYSSRETFQSVCDRLGKIEDILGDEYDLDRLLELVKADRERDAAVDCIYKIEDDLDRGTDNDWAREHISEWESQKED